MSKIRVGMIRCDLHAIYYANLIQDHDPHILREPECGKGGYFYFYTRYNNTRQMVFPKVPGFEVTKLWDANRALAENMAKIYLGKPRVCDTLAEVSDDVDLVFIADCNGDGSDHLRLAAPGLKKGVPTFIDKPFAHDIKDARAIVRLAQKHRAPVMSLSILRVVPQFTLFRNRFAELEQPEFGVIKGGGTTLAGQIHAISLAQHLFGPGVESVESMGPSPLAHILLDYGGKPDRPKAGVMLNCASGGTYHCAFYASAYSKWGAIHSPGIGDFEFPDGVIDILKKIRKMALTRKPQAPYDEMLECVAIASAARLSHGERRRVRLSEV
ncbi:MAG: Gfo/Idh/MocA family oxidoreductase [Planctomycetes bacterium]|nr:Gfo/Idh/MocA family oxidoreductase [Planctomycetota bacterium]MBM4080325.1 Gfo/Idh/MocA family oxidoreductase [Planctomycetota bacterium]